MKPEPYIPLRVSDLVDVLVTEAGTPAHAPLPADQHAAFRQFAAALAERIDSGYRKLRATIQDAYSPFDPDSETLRLGDGDDADHHERLARLFDGLTVLLERGGFHRMSREEIESTMQGSSHWGIEMDVCWDVFDRVEVFYRGHGMGWRTRRIWWKFFKTQEVEVPTFRRVVLMFKQQPHKRLGPHADTNHVYIKIFKDIPSMDLEMLLPGTRLRMPKLERGKLGGTALLSLILVVAKIVTSISIGALISGSTVAMATLLFLLGGYMYKTVFKYRFSKRSYLLQLTQSLYYQGLDSNAGVLHRLFDEAAEQDVRQTLLAYFFLWRFAGAGWTVAQLDREIERDLEHRVGVKIEVDTEEAIERLARFGLVNKNGESYTAVPMENAIASVQNGQAMKEQSRWLANLTGEIPTAG